MFICALCHKQPEPKEKQFSLVAEYRNKTYSNNTVGQEIVKEIKICELCFNKA